MYASIIQPNLALKCTYEALEYIHIIQLSYQLNFGRIPAEFQLSYRICIPQRQSFNRGSNITSSCLGNYKV